MWDGPSSYQQNPNSELSQFGVESTIGTESRPPTIVGGAASVGIVCPKVRAHGMIILERLVAMAMLRSSINT